MVKVCSICREDADDLTQRICSKCYQFFQRAINEKRMRRCKSPCEDKEVGSSTFCRYCRLQKILNQGIIIEDHLSWNESILKTRYWGSMIKKLDGTTSDPQFFELLLLQKYQRELHENYNTLKVGDNETGVVKINQKNYRCATSSDINLVLHIGFRNAIDFANQFQSFKNIEASKKQLILSEFGVSFILIDQAFKSTIMTDDEFWFLQNSTFLNANYLFEDGEKVRSVGQDANPQGRYHLEYVTGLMNEIKGPFFNLEIDAMECVYLKALLLFAPSFPQRVNVEDSNEIVTRCLTYLMDYSIKKHPTDGMVRYGEIIILVGSIRCSVKSFYNQTTVSNLFHVSNFDEFVRSSFAT